MRGKLNLILMGGVGMLNKSLIQFSVDEWSCVPSMLFTWGQTMVEVMNIVITIYMSIGINGPISVIWSTNFEIQIPQGI